MAEVRSYLSSTGRLPTVSQLQERADVGRGTAGAVLKELRENSPGLHLVTEKDTARASNRSDDDINAETPKAQP